MRRGLEETADRWGIPYTTETSEDELRVLIEKRQRRSPEMTDVETTPADAHKCYGILWEGVEGRPCMDCAYVRGGCLQVFVTKRLPILREQIKGNPSLEQLSIAAGAPQAQGRPLKQEALLVALSIEQKLQKGEAAFTEPQQEADLDAWATDESKPLELDPPPVQAQDEQQKSDTIGEQEAPQQTQSKEAPVSTKRKAPQRKKAAAPKAPAKKKKAGAKKAAAKKKKKAPAKKKVVENPPKAGPAQRAKAPAKLPPKGKKKPKTVQPAKAQQLDSQDSHQRPSTQKEKASWLRRWEEERLKHPEFAKAVPQSILQREFKGQLYRVQVHKGSYHLAGTEIWVPTLGMMTTILTGTTTYQRQVKVPGKDKTRPKGTRQLSNWSAKRFWKTAFEDR